MAAEVTRWRPSEGGAKWSAFCRRMCGGASAKLVDLLRSLQYMNKGTDLDEHEQIEQDKA